MGILKIQGELIFGYKLHTSCSTGKLIVPLSADVSTANVHDGKMYCTLVEALAGLVENVLCDLTYDDWFIISV